MAAHRASSKVGAERDRPDRGSYSIGEVVQLTGVPASSIHHYRRLGLVPEPDRAVANRFVYDERHVLSLRVIRAMRRRRAPLEQVERALPVLLCTPIGITDDLEEAVDEYLVSLPEEAGPRIRLVEAAIESFATRGYRDVSIARLCEQAGIAKGTFYRYFDGKDAVFLTAAAMVIERAIDDFTADIAAGAEGDPWVVFARHLRHGLPVLFELAKQSIQDAGASAEAAAGLFHDLAERLGRAVDGADPPADGAFVIMMAVVEIFTGLVEPGGSSPDPN